MTGKGTRPYQSVDGGRRVVEGQIESGGVLRKGLDWWGELHLWFSDNY